MEKLIKTDDYKSLGNAEFNRVVYDTTIDAVFLQSSVNSLDENVYVDLGLPSGLLWMKKNLGAESEEDAGLYYQWGDTQGYTKEQLGRGEGKKYFGWDDYKFSIGGSDSNFSKYNETDGKTVLDLEDDAVYAAFGGNHRMPTYYDFKELYANTDCYAVKSDDSEIHGTYNGDKNINWDSSISGNIKGIKFYNKTDKNKYVFVPVSGRFSGGSLSNSQGGYLWSSSLSSSNVSCSWYCHFNSGYAVLGDSGRYVGRPVRGVFLK